MQSNSSQSEWSGPYGVASVKRLANTVNGNPRFSVATVNGLRFLTRPDSNVALNFESVVYPGAIVEFVTRHGEMIVKVRSYTPSYNSCHCGAPATFHLREAKQGGGRQYASCSEHLDVALEYLSGLTVVVIDLREE